MSKVFLLIAGVFFMGMGSLWSQTPECTPTSDLGSMVRICQGSGLILNPGNNPGASFLWSTGAQTQTITVNQSGVYWVTITNNCGSITDSIEVIVDQPIQPSFGGTLGLCPQSNDTLRFTLPDGVSHIWSTGHQGRVLDVTAPGQFWGSYTNACGTFSDTFQVIWSAVPVFDLGPDTFYCANTTFRLSVPSNLGSVVWSTGAQNDSINVRSTGTYWATVTNSCGTFTDSVHITRVPNRAPIIPDTLGICGSDAVPVSAFSNIPPFTTVDWSNNTSGNSTTYNTAGDHYAVINGPCLNDTIHFHIMQVNSLPAINLGDTIIACGEQVFDVGPQHVTTQITWHDSSNGQTVMVNTTTLVTVTLSNACGSVSDQVMVYTLMPPDSVPLIDTLEICPHEVGSAIVPGPPGDSLFYLWSTGDTTQNTTALQLGYLYLSVYNRCDSVYDSVYVALTPPISLYNLPNDTTFCEGDSLVIDGTDPNAEYSNSFSYRWYRDNELVGNGAEFTINQTGQYTFFKTNGCDTIIDEMNVSITPLPKEVIDSVINACFGDTVWMRPDTNATFYQWSNGFNGIDQPVIQSGIYAVTVANYCDTIIDSVEVVFEMPFPFYSTKDSIVKCEGPVIIDAPIPGARYEWSNGSEESFIEVDSTGKYWVRVLNSCDTVVDTTTVYITGPPASVLGTNVVICRGNQLVIDAQNLGSTYLWSTGDTTRNITVSDAGMYFVDIENPCGTFRDSIDVIIVYPLKLSLGDDIIACVGDTVVLDAENEHSNYLWNTGETSQSIKVDTSGNYFVRVTNPCGFRVDTINVTFLDVPEFSLDSAFRCFNTQSVRVRAPSGLRYSYQWSNGDTTRSSDITFEGAHWLTIDNGCFTYTDTFYLEEEYPLDLSISPDTLLCAGDYIDLVVDVPSRWRVRWNTGDTSRAIRVNKPGNYVGIVKNTCGEYFDTVRVHYDVPPDPNPIDELLCWGNTYTHDLMYDHQRSVLWEDGDTSLVREFDKGGAYSYALTNVCGTYQQSLNLTEDNCDCPFYVPNAFTPNGDGVNDYFKYGYDCTIIDFTIRIFSRWGKQVYYSTDQNSFWDGTDAGAPLPIGAYTYIISFDYRKNGQNESKYLQGSISIIH